MDIQQNQDDRNDISDICGHRINNEDIDDDDEISNDLIDNEEELNRVLNGKDEVKREMVLKCKVNELQKICNSLANTNCQL
jgi:hypothetical protein